MPNLVEMHEVGVSSGVAKIYNHNSHTRLHTGILKMDTYYDYNDDYDDAHNATYSTSETKP